MKTDKPVAAGRKKRFAVTYPFAGCFEVEVEAEDWREAVKLAPQVFTNLDDEQQYDASTYEVGPESKAKATLIVDEVTDGAS